MKSFDAWTDEIADRIAARNSQSVESFTDLDTIYLGGLPLSKFGLPRVTTNLYFDSNTITFYYATPERVKDQSYKTHNHGEAKNHDEWSRRLWPRENYYKYVKELDRLFIKHPNLDVAWSINVVYINCTADITTIKDYIESFFDQLHI